MLKSKQSADPPFCAACGQAISGMWITAMDRVWHPEHFVCAHCAKPIGEASFHMNEEQPYHRKCLVDVLSLRCGGCGRDCPESYMKDGRGGKFCPDCFRAAKSCFFCGRTLPAGRSCSVCAPLVDDSRVAAREFDAAIFWLKSTGIPFEWTLRDIQLSLTNNVPSKRLIQHTGQRHMGLTEVRWTDNGSGRRYTISVAMRLSLPSLVFRGVAAHELGHVWLLTSGITHLRENEAEGFCELLSYLYYRNVKTPEAAYQAKRIRENPDPVYGGGFRNLVEAHKGLELPQLATRLSQQVSRGNSLRNKWFF